MQAVRVEQIGSFTVTDVPIPQPGPGEVLVEVLVTGLCRTDLKLIEHGHRDLVLPRTPAEEVVGRVCTCGPEVDIAWLDREVYVYPGTCCGRCRACRTGAENLCRDMAIMGFHRDGGFAEYVVCPEASLIPLPAGMDPDEAVFAEPLSCCLNALELARLQTGEHMAIWGAGPAGRLLARAATAMGASATLIEPDPARRASAEAVAEAGPGHYDAAVVAVGHHAAYQEALHALGPRGRLVVFSGLAPDHCIQPVDLNQLHYHEQSLVGAYGCSYRHGRQALQWIHNDRVPVRDMISHRLPLSRLVEALDLVRHRQGLKILLYPDRRGDTPRSATVFSPPQQPGGCHDKHYNRPA